MSNDYIKKELYKQSPTAFLLGITKTSIDYQTILADNSVIIFNVPISDLGNSTFYAEMPAKHLIRYISEVRKPQP